MLNFVWFNVLLLIFAQLAANIFYQWRSVLIKSSMMSYSPFSEFVRFIAMGYQYVVGNNFSHYPETTVLGHIVRLLVVYCGYNIRYFHFVPQLFVSYLRYEKHEMQYRNFMSHMITCAGLTGAKKSLKISYVTFYNELWNFYKGVFSPQVAKIYPTSLRKDMVVDLFWDAIRHSHSLAPVGLPLKRSIALLMTGDFYKPGDFLFRTGITKCQMIYIVSGHIQILSDVDGTSPLATLSSGTLFGGQSVIFPSKSAANVKCITFVEVMALNISQLYSTLNSYPWEIRYLRMHSYERLRNAEFLMLSRTETDRRKMGNRLGVRGTRLKWIKRRWRLLYNCEKRPHLMDDKTLWVTNDPSHTSTFLGLMAFSDVGGSLQECFCLSTKWPFVVNPHSTALKYWEIIVILTILLEAIMLPLWFCFKYSITPTIQRFLTVIGFIYVLDIYLLLITSDYEEETLMQNPSKVIRHRLRIFRTIIELISALPISIFLLIFFPDATDSIIFDFELLRLLKFYRVVKFFRKLEHSILSSYLVFKAARLVVTFFIFHWWSACILYVVPCYSTCTPNSWYYASTHYDKVVSYQLFTIDTPLKMAIHYTQSIILKIDFYSLVITEPVDLAMGVITLCLSHNLFIYITASYTATLIMRRSSVSAFGEYVLALNEVLTEKLVSKQHKKGMFELVHLQWQFNDGAYIIFDRPIYLEAPRDLSIYFYQDLEALISSVPLFSAKNLAVSHFVSSLARHSTIHWVPRGRVLTKACVIPLCLDIILKGHCNMVSHLPEDKTDTSGVCLLPGACFPLLEVIHILPTRITVYTVTDCELLTIRSTDFHLLLNANEAVKNRLLVDSEKVYKSLGKTNCKPTSFRLTVDINRSNWLTRSESKVKPPRWSLEHFVSIIFMKYRINPDGRFLTIWESQRIVFILFSLPFFMFYYTFFVIYYPEVSKVLAVIFDVMSFIDIYVRMNIGVIGQCGLLQTDPVLSFMNYLKHSLFVDLIAAMPYYLLFNVTGPVRTFWFFLFVCKSLPVYRIFNFINRKRNSVMIYYRFLKFLKVIIMFAVFIAFMVNKVTFQLCLIEFYQNRYHRLSCRPDEFIDGISPAQLLRVSFYIATSFQSPNAMTKLIKTLIITNTEETLIYHLIAMFFKISVIIYFCSYYVGKNLRYREYVIEMWHVISIMKDFKIKKELINKVESFYILNYRSVRNNWVTKKMRALHPSFKEQYNVLCLKRCIKKVSSLKNMSEDMTRVMVDNLTEVFTPKDVGLLGWNDLNSNIYIVWKGEVKVSVASSAKTHLLGPGSVFGCFNRVGNYRHMFTYTPTINTCCLKMSSSVLYSIFDCFPFQNKLFIKSIQPCKEYLIEPRKKSQSVRLRKFPKLFSPENRSTNFLNALYYYILPLLTIFFVSGYLAVDQMGILIYLIYAIDCLYLFKIFVSLTIPILDGRGIMETRTLVIAKVYLKRVSGFALDLISSFPIDLIFALAGSPIKYLVLNRALRIWHLQMHYVYRKRNFRKNLAYKMMDIFMYTIIVPVTLSSIYCTWYGTSIRITGTTADPDPFSIFVVLFLSIGMGIVGDYLDIDVKSENLTLLAIFNILLFVMFCLLATKMLDFYELILHYRDAKEYLTFKSKIFFQRRSLSEKLLRKSADYTKMKFYMTEGRRLTGHLEMLPLPLKKATIYKKFQAEAFGDNYLFDSVHPAMLSQLTTRLRREIFFPNNYICIKGDVDGTLVFLKQGDVEVILQGVGVYENVLTLLTAGDYFGILNGLFPANFYSHTYKARTVVEVFTLQRNSWLDLQRSFLTDTQEIYRRCSSVILQNIQLNNKILGIKKV